ncbi:hypothetical protein GLOTRDRAFT_134634 [Gloeophyllum trabeum ATCC 11539]|uniref:Uncharacterized protein n=1 Tax=Gloeophyllum trabeum (strain ATCC 11539 / FP-39264 / Madison 617) TaxID=670483 RepID=S7R5W2_GLOTA|nr:uncharacterized protein GLOTRDRAFT_134634 [Gloeophyllum trabeum ATCC 11539]EPQ49770.1 hypothetical protein GLOTRDRAFT_134634 [Gloeophyllum trabeum ATCC 11539]
MTMVHSGKVSYRYALDEVGTDPAPASRAEPSHSRALSPSRIAKTGRIDIRRGTRAVLGHVSLS